MEKCRGKKLKQIISSQTCLYVLSGEAENLNLFYIEYLFIIGKVKKVYFKAGILLICILG